MKANGFVFVSGQMPASLENKKIKLNEGTVAEKTHLMCRNAATILEAAGSSLEKVVKVTVSAAHSNMPKGNSVALKADGAPRG